MCASHQCCHNVYYVPSPYGGDGCVQRVHCAECDEIPFEDVDLAREELWP